MEPAKACAPDQTALILALILRRFDDPDAVPQCWQVTSLSPDSLVLADKTGTNGEVSLTRITEGDQTP
jgi:hypothetical protein